VFLSFILTFWGCTCAANNNTVVISRV